MKNRLLMLLMVFILGSILWRVRADETVPFAPSVVAKVELTNITSGSGPTTLLTPNNDHDYELLVYAISPTSGNSSLRVRVDWTDEFMNHEIQNLVGSGNLDSSQIYGSTQGAFPIVLHVKGGTSITYTLEYNAGTSNIPFDLFLTLTKY